MREILPDPSGHRDVALGLARDGAGRVLLVWNARSAQGLAKQFWDLPGGTVEAGESLEHALRREWQEEVGTDVLVGELLLVVDGRKRVAEDAPPLYTWRAFVFEVRLPEDASPRAGAEIERVEWVSASDAILQMDAPYQAPVVAWLRGERARYASVDWVEPATDAVPSSMPPDARHLLVIAAAAATGDAALVLREAGAAIAEGVAVDRIEEALLQIVPYAGFPRALAAFSAARPALGTPSPSSAPSLMTLPIEAAPPSFPATGERAFATVYGDSSARVREGLVRLHPLLPPWTIEFAYGRVLSRLTLAPVEREILAVAILTAMGGADDALLGHMRAAVRLGASRESVAGAIAVVPASAGAGKRAAARALLPRV